MCLLTCFNFVFRTPPIIFELILHLKRKVNILLKFDVQHLRRPVLLLKYDQQILLRSFYLLTPQRLVFLNKELQHPDCVTFVQNNHALFE